MTKAEKMAFLRAEKGTLEHAVQTVSGILERASFEYRLDEVIEEIAGLETTQDRATAQIKLVFYGAPVVEAVGIEAGFAADALAAYQDLIAKAAVPANIMQASGPIRASRLARLHVTDLIRGSFGFELRDLAPVDGSALSATVEESARLIEAAGSNDDEFVDTIVSYHPRVQQALATFFKTISDADATFQLATNESIAEFPKEKIAAASARLARNIRQEEDTEEEELGFLLGVLPHSRQFEFGEPKSSETWKGRVAREADVDEIARFANTEVLAKFRVSHWQRNDRPMRRYTLISVEPL